MYDAGRDLDRDMMAPVGGVEMRNTMFPVEHADHDTKEPRNLWHSPFTSRPGRDIQRRQGAA